MLKNVTITDVCAVSVVNVPTGSRRFTEKRPSYGLCLCQSGCITYEHKGTQYVSDPQHAVLLPKGESYSLYGNDSGLFPLVNFQCTEEFSQQNFVLFPLQCPDKCLREFLTLQEQFFFKQERAMCMSSLYRLFNCITEGVRPVHNLLDSAMEYLHQHLSDPELNNCVLAKQARVSEVHFRRLFLETYRMTPKQYIMDMRLRLAKQLLENTCDSVGEIAEHCGFSSVYYFSRFFHKMMGKAPTEYRRDNSVRGI